MKAKIKEGARVSQDMGAYKWKNNNIVFDVFNFNGDKKKCMAPGYGYISNKGEFDKYGNGAIYVWVEDLIYENIKNTDNNTDPVLQIENIYINVSDFEKYVRKHFNTIVSGKGLTVPRIIVKFALDEIFDKNGFIANSQKKGD